MVYVCNEILLNHKMNEILPFTTWVDLESIILSEISQKQKEQLHHLNYMWNLKKLNTQKQSRMVVELWWGGRKLLVK